MWQLEYPVRFKGQYHRYWKKHPEEAEQALDNLHTYLEALNSGLHPSQINGRYCRHKEGDGVRAVDETGMKGRPHVTRL